MKKLLKSLLAFALLFTFTACSSSDDETSISDDTTTTDETVVEDTGNKIGDTVRVDDIEFVVNSVDTTTDNLGDEYYEVFPDEVFLVINVTVTNDTNESISVDTDCFKLVKGEKTFDLDSDGSIYIEDSIVYESVNPESSITGSVVFDVNQDTIDDESLQLQVSAGWLADNNDVIDLH